jgi:hypothetical protein
MTTIRIINTLQGQQTEINGTTITLNGQGVTEIDVYHWLELKNIYNSKIDNGYIYPENIDEERQAIEIFRSDFFSKLDDLGAPAVKSSPESKGVKLQLINEWLALKDDERENRRDAREDSAILIAKEANGIARSEANAAARSARWAMYMAIIAAISAMTANKDDIILFVSWLLSKI